MNNFKVTACDTDSIFFKKPEGSFFRKEERTKLLQELNNLMPEKIRWEVNDYFPTLITLKAKNYIMQLESGEVKCKGSALKSSKIEPALKEFLYAIIDTILQEKYQYKEIYEKYVQEILNLKDITRFASKKTLTSTTYESERKNETKIIDAIEGTEFREGDRILVYFTTEGNLKLVENWQNDHDIPRLLKKLFTTAKTFATIGLMDNFTNYGLVKNLKLLGLK